MCSCWGSAAVCGAGFGGGDAGYGYFGDYDAERSYGSYAIPLDGSDGTINIVRPRYVDIYVR